MCPDCIALNTFIRDSYLQNPVPIYLILSSLGQLHSICHRNMSLQTFFFIGVQLFYNVVLVSTVQWSSLCYTAGSYQLSILYILVYTCQSESPSSSHHPLLSPLGVHTFVLYICVSISALQTGSSVPFFQIPHICVNVRYLFFSF